jgi:hypothetical protein
MAHDAHRNADDEAIRHEEEYARVKHHADELVPLGKLYRFDLIDEKCNALRVQLKPLSAHVPALRRSASNKKRGEGSEASDESSRTSDKQLDELAADRQTVRVAREPIGIEPVPDLPSSDDAGRDEARGSRGARDRCRTAAVAVARGSVGRELERIERAKRI